MPLDDELEEEADAVALAAAVLVEPVAASYEVVAVVLELSPPEDADSSVLDAADEGPDTEPW